MNVPAITWKNNTPYSVKFDDCYYPPNLGFEQAQYIFLQGNQLQERFTSLLDKQTFVIGETGFGTGLNFLTALQAFEQYAPQNTKLHFISCEKYPLKLSEIKQALSFYPNLHNQTELLLHNYQAISPNSFQLLNITDRVTLHLLLTDSVVAFNNLNAQIDALFLDGFNPRTNCEMWSIELFNALAKLSHSQTTFSTFTSAGYVKRNLQNAGFKTSKKAGFAGKREHLYGIYVGKNTNYVSDPDIKNTKQKIVNHLPEKPWFIRPNKAKTSSIAIIGAGIAGASCAYSLAKRGFKVTVFEQNNKPAQMASGNQQGGLFLKLSAHDTPLTSLLLSGFGYTRRLLAQITNQQIWENCGLLQLGITAKEIKRMQDLAQVFAPDLAYLVDKEEASKIAGINLSHSGLFFPQSGWVSPPKLCEYLLDLPNIKLITNCFITNIRHINNEWQLFNEGNLIYQSTILINASGANFALYPFNHLGLKTIRGQTTLKPVNEITKPLKTVICNDCYVTPFLHGFHTLGASFDFGCDDPKPILKSTLHNLNRIAMFAPQITANAKQQKLGHKVGFRCSAFDNLPVIGPIADPLKFNQIYAKLAEDSKFNLTAPCPFLQGLYLSMAHGSRGMITAPLAGEIIASYINCEPLSLPQYLLNAVNPNRLLFKKLVRGL